MGVLHWVRTVIIPHYGEEFLGARTVNELLSLAAAIDAVMRGDISNALDVPAQRLRGVEEFCRAPKKCGNRWALANEMMLTPDLSIGSIPEGDRKAAVRAADRTARQAQAEANARAQR